MKTLFLTGWQLLRGTNLVLVAISLSLLLIKAKIQLSIYQWVALLGGTMSIAGAGNLVNDIFDQDIDQINAAARRIVGVLITEKAAWQGYYLLNAIALLLALGTENWVLCSCHGLAILVLYAYSKWWKCRAWIGNIAVAFLCSLSLLQLLGVEPLQWNFYWTIGVVIYASFAFLTNWWRELIKDIEDKEGDCQNGCQTLVVKQGEAYSIKIGHYLCNALLLWLVLLLCLLWKFAPWGACLYTTLLLLPMTSYLKWRLGTLENTVAIHQFSQLLKGYMLMGLIGILFL